MNTEDHGNHVPVKQTLTVDPLQIMFTQIEYGGIWFPPNISASSLDNLKTFEVREDDIVVSTYPKAGSHWIMELILLMQQDGRVEKIQRPADPETIGCLEFNIPPDFKRKLADKLTSWPSPRLYLTHLTVELLPPQIWTKKTKLIYITRNPKDACLSWYNFMNSDPNKISELQWEQYFELFMSEKAPWGNWCDHSLGYWNCRDRENVLFITYEEMKKDIRLVIRRLESFMGMAITPEGLERIIEHSTVKGMKNTYQKVEQDYKHGHLISKAFGKLPFIYKGLVGGWKDRFTVAQSERVDKMLKEKLTGTGLEVHYNWA